MKHYYFRSVNHAWYFAITPQEKARVFNDLLKPQITTLSVCPVVVHESIVECSQQEFEQVKANVQKWLDFQEKHESMEYPDYTGL